LHPGSVRTHISVDTAPQAQPFAIAIRSLQREAIRLDPNWKDGNYDIQGRMSAASTGSAGAADIHAAEGGTYPDIGMSIARKLGVITYRSAMEWNGRFARIRLDPEQRDDDPFGREFQVESYLEGHAQRFVRTFDPNSYLYLSRASDWFDMAEYGNGSVHRRAQAHPHRAGHGDRRQHRHPVPAATAGADCRRSGGGRREGGIRGAGLTARPRCFSWSTSNNRRLPVAALQHRLGFGQFPQRHVIAGVAKTAVRR
jgi:hypothetical protein